MRKHPVLFYFILENAVEPRISRRLTDYQTDANLWKVTPQVNGFEPALLSELFLYPWASVMVCVQSNKTLVKQGGVRKLGSNSWVNSAKTT